MVLRPSRSIRRGPSPGRAANRGLTLFAPVSLNAEMARMQPNTSVLHASRRLSPTLFFAASARRKSVGEKIHLKMVCIFPLSSGRRRSSTCGAARS